MSAFAPRARARVGVGGACPSCGTLIRKLNQPDDCECGSLRREGSVDKLRDPKSTTDKRRDQ